MVHNSQRFSFRSDGQLDRVTFRRPTEIHAADVWDLIALCPQLDRNSLYCELLLCSDFADTFVLAQRARKVVGCLAAYRRPSHPSTLVVWQIAVHPKVRNTGLGKGLIVSALNRRSGDGVTHINVTVTLQQYSLRIAFAAVARDQGAPIRQAFWFDRQAHFKGRLDCEYMIAIGPI
ncbi:diaminobutyrate acetyltransferase [Mesorhizobium sp. M0217]|uniref:diaminobutyrate acetyltransferase n=1 Tax=unclassified Mesorhizobium TaxID=325217 RepID=UPI00333A3910